MTDIKPTSWEVTRALERAAKAMEELAAIFRDRGNRPLDEPTIARMEKPAHALARVGKALGCWVRAQGVVGGPDVSSQFTEEEL